MPESTDLPTPPKGDGGTGKTFTQAEVDHIVAERLTRERAKFADYEDMAAKAAKFDELETKNQSEVEKLTKQLTDLTAKSDAAESKALRAEVAMAKGLTPGQAKRLAGATREELETDADELLASFPAPGAGTPPPPPGTKPTPVQGGNNPTDTPVEMDPAKLAASVPRD